MEMLEQESSDLADRLIQVQPIQATLLAGTQSSTAPFVASHLIYNHNHCLVQIRVKSDIYIKTPDRCTVGLLMM